MSFERYTGKAHLQHRRTRREKLIQIWRRHDGTGDLPVFRAECPLVPPLKVEFQALPAVFHVWDGDLGGRSG